MGRDITDYRHAEKVLWGSEECYIGLLDASGSVCTISPGGTTETIAGWYRGIHCGGAEFGGVKRQVFMSIAHDVAERKRAAEVLDEE